jgi:hypothetical protein
MGQESGFGVNPINFLDQRTGRRDIAQGLMRRRARAGFH